jgi:hypothetical protein
MPSEKWFGQDTASKAIWDCLDDRAKSIILGYTKPESPQSWFPTHTFNFRRPPVSQSGKTPSSPKLISMRSLLMIFSVLTSMMLRLLDTFLMLVSEDGDPHSSEDTNGSSMLQIPHGTIRRVMSKYSTRCVNSK